MKGHSVQPRDRIFVKGFFLLLNICIKILVKIWVKT